MIARLCVHSTGSRGEGYKKYFFCNFLLFLYEAQNWNVLKVPYQSCANAEYYFFFAVTLFTAWLHERPCKRRPLRGEEGVGGGMYNTKEN